MHEGAELFELVRENYHKANQDYIKRQISIATEYLTDEQKNVLTENLVEKTMKQNTSFCNNCIYISVCVQPKRHHVTGCGVKIEKPKKD